MARPRIPARALAVSPMVAIWEVTRACDLACTHCRASAMARRDPRELTTAEGLDLIEQLAELDPGVVVLTGGDPVKRPDLFELIAAAVRRGLNVAVAPSVTPLLTADVVARFAAAGVRRIALSLDGPDAATHDGMRGVPGAFARTLEAIRAARAVDLPIQINTSLTRITVERLAETAALVEEVAPALWSVFIVVPTGRAGRDVQLDADACERVFEFLYAWSVRTGLPVKTTAAEAFRRVVVTREAERARRDPAYRRRPAPPPVNDGKGFVFVSHTGDVQPSGFLPITAGNVREERLASIYRTSALFRSLRSEWLIEGKCGRCPYRTLCGGSRARAYATTGNPLAADPACAYQPPEAPASVGGELG
ncbi:MAG: TIGR04053 family radical SAM/SPASM domain-containing protein [Candidatus Binatia bacterium]